MDRGKGHTEVIEACVKAAGPFICRLLPAVFLFSAFAVQVDGQLLSITARFDNDTIWIGEQTFFTVTVEQPEDMFVSLPDISGSISERIEILGSWPADTVNAGGGRVIVSKSSLVTSFTSGEHYADAMPFVFFLEGDEKVLHSAPVRLEVIAPEIDQSEGIYDIKAPFGVSWGLAEILPWVLLLIVAGLTLWYLIRYLKRRKEYKPPYEPLPASPPEQAHVIALRELNHLKEESLWQKGRLKEYYTRLTEIVRIYIERRFGIMAMEMTSDEITGRLRGMDSLNSELTGLLADCLSVADLVKFAKARPGEQFHHDSMNTALRFVKETGISPVNESNVQREINQVVLKK